MRARSQAFVAETLPAEVYRRLLDRNFRRSGTVFYRAACDACSACKQLRVLVNRFRWTRSLRRVWRINADVRVSIGAPEATPEKWRVFQSYLCERHDGHMSGEWDHFVDFLYASPVPTVEFCYRVGERLLAVSICDRFADALNSVYVYFDPEEAQRSLGTFSALWEIDYCRRLGLDYYYLGYYVAGSRTMAYKARFGEHETLSNSTTWLSSPITLS